ncbi:MAG: AAA family ATPase [Paludibacteraceae bacterium]|nr:AAA family ATPase [Paludibacteraceae bacterium]
MEVKQKWVKETGVFYPIPGDTTLHITPGMGVFQLYEEKSMAGSRLGLRRMADKFTFNFKIYDLDAEEIMQKIETTWNSDVFVSGNKNLGVIFNGLKGTGKTIASKILSNRFNMPVIVVNAPYDGLVNFIQSLCFECVVLIDEAEKTFCEENDVLLKMIDGVYNESRKLYILTTNRLNIDENLIGRPGRIRYIKQFGNLTAKAVSDYISDNLIDKTKTSQILDVVDGLQISTIDILKSIVDEVNIHGSIEENTILNIPKASYKIEIIQFEDVSNTRLDELKTFILQQLAIGESVGEWLRKPWIDADGERKTNQDQIDDKFDAECYSTQIASNFPVLTREQDTRIGIVTEGPDTHGFFTVRNSWSEKESLCCIISYHDAPSLYRGGLQKLYA